MQIADEHAFRRIVEPHVRELTAHCYRMSGSLHDAEELMQETLLRAWKGLAGFAERSSLRTWLFRVATRVCLDELEKRPTRALPMDFTTANGAMLPPRLEPVWIEPAPMWMSEHVAADAAVDARESVQLAFLVALQRLPPRQRAVVILRDVVGHDAKECADALDMTVAGVNSALQRARDTLDKRAPVVDAVDDRTRALLERYVRAWESSDVEALVALLRDDAVLSMPPLPTWLAGAREIGASLAAMVLVPGSAGAFTLTSLTVSARPGFAMYARGDDGVRRPVSLHVVDVIDGRVAAITAFADPTLFARFDLPATL